MNDTNQHEIDDELLSAYLDDELSTEERTLVESRLATDPAARQTLEQLRSVSQSVRDLPTESVGRDLRDTILRRAALAKAENNEPASRAVPGPESPAPHTQSSPRSPTASPLPNISIGRTMRGWVWASAAIAAAVLIMVLQPGDEQNADLPDIARNDKPAGGTSAPMNRQLAESRPADRTMDLEPAPAPAMPPSQAPSAPAAPSEEFAASGRAGSAPNPLLESATTDGQPNSDSFAFTAPSEADLESAVPPAAEQSSVAMSDADDEPIVVRVLARRSAVESNAFEALLRKNQVDVDPNARRFAGEEAAAAREPAPADSARIEAPSAKAAAKEARESELTDGSPVAPATTQRIQENGSVELVLVDAPPSTILSCMNELSDDADNYPVISVDDTSPTDKAPRSGTTSKNSQVSELRKFNRGVVPPWQDFRAKDVFFYDFAADEVTSYDAPARSHIASGALDSDQKNESRALGHESESDRGRALRLRLRLRATESLEEKESSSNVATFGGQTQLDAKRMQPAALDQLQAPTTPDRNRMQVLFVIRPSDEPAPSLKAKNKAE